jgi:hypothetical protein
MSFEAWQTDIFPNRQEGKEFNRVQRNSQAFHVLRKQSTPRPAARALGTPVAVGQGLQEGEHHPLPNL